MPAPKRFGPGRQPYDALNGLRVGGLAGGLVGALAALVTGIVGLILVGAVLGSVIGYATERKALLRSAPDEDRPGSP